MAHEFKTLAIKYHRNGFKFTVYAQGTGEDALKELMLHPDMPSIETIGIDSWGWVQKKLASIDNIDALTCMTVVGLGDWTLSVLCNDA